MKFTPPVSEVSLFASRFPLSSKSPAFLAQEINIIDINQKMIENGTVNIENMFKMDLNCECYKESLNNEIDKNDKKENIE